MSDWTLRITYCDVANDCFLALGGATFRTKRERDENLRTIPRAPGDSDFILDVMSERGIEDDRLIDAAMVEMLMRRPVTDLIHDARAAAGGGNG